jgi:prepilin-type N-terminal cleavage/methylation domain-containing protein
MGRKLQISRLAIGEWLTRSHMDSTMRNNKQQKLKNQKGFTLLEAVISMAVVTIGLVGVLAAFAAAIGSTTTVQYDTIARQKATEALESIYTARQTAQLAFAAIQNTSAGGTGIFLPGMNPLTDPGPDGLDGTVDDVPATPIIVPGYTGSQTGSTPSTATISLNYFQRQIAIGNVTNPDGSINANLRQITVTIQYPGPQGTPRTYTVQALVSAYR